MDEISRTMKEETFAQGSMIFTERTRADNFYILWEGSVRLTVGEEAEIDYSVSRRGEVFGWSSMLDRECYSARAEAMAPTRAFRIGKEQLDHIFERHPDAGMIFMKRLGGAVAQRLVDTYATFLSEGKQREITSHGTEEVAYAAEM
jgi:CRP-like cAMP-binding protein